MLLAACSDGGTSPDPEIITPGRMDPAPIETTATVGATMSASPGVVLRDTKGRPLAGATVTFQVTAGGGTIEHGAATTGPDGAASAGAWQLGTRPGLNTLQASASGVPPVTFSVQANVGPATSLAAHSANTVEAVAGQQLAPGPAVVILDAFGNPVSGVLVTFMPVTGCGKVAQSAVPTDADGVARVVWTLGGAAGTQTLQATVGTLAAALTVRAAPGSPSALEILAGNAQSGMAGEAVAVPPTARVRDAFGNGVPGVTVQFAASEGSGLVTGASAVSDTAGVARVGGWTLGTRAGSNTLTVTVPGLPAVSFTASGSPGPAARLDKLAGDGQAARAGEVLPVAPAVTVSDTYGNPVAGATVSFTAAAGTITEPVAVTDSSGTARVGSWQLGSSPGTQTLTARTGDLMATFSATAAAGPPAVVQIAAGEGQTADAGTAVPIPPAVLVKDALGNPVSGVTVSYALPAGSGDAMVTGASAETGEDGVARVGGWTLATVAGLNRLVASVSEVGSVTFNATGRPGPAARIVKLRGDGQTATSGTNVAVRPAVRVTDAFNNPVAAATVTFAASAGGRITGGSQITAADGSATVGSWTLSDSPGSNTLTARVTDVTAVTFTATSVTTPPPPPPPSTPFNVEVRYLTTVSAGQRAAFEGAVDRWQTVITADITDLNLNIAAGSCGSNSPAISERIDDLVILVTLENIDGAGGTLGSAGPCYVRGGSGLPLLGRMRLDTSDLAALETGGRLEDVILHEMGHVLGIGILWDDADLLVGAGSADPFFTGAGAGQRFVLAGGTVWPGNGVPVENTGASGTRDAHWRESVFRTELMTGWISMGSANPLSAVTIASLADLGYAVSLAAADAYTVPSTSGYELESAAVFLEEEPLPPPRVAY